MGVLRTSFCLLLLRNLHVGTNRDGSDICLFHWMGFVLFRMCRALMPGDEESMSDEAIWETLPVSSSY
jgi:hypothetical protein